MTTESFKLSKKYHINDKGEPGICNALFNKCPYGDSETDHWPSKKEARSAYANKANSLLQEHEKAKHDFDIASETASVFEDSLEGKQENFINDLGNVTAEDIDEGYEKLRELYDNQRIMFQRMFLASKKASDFGLIDEEIIPVFPKTKTMARLQELYCSTQKTNIDFNEGLNPEIESAVVMQLASWNEISVIEAEKLFHDWTPKHDLTRDEYVVNLFQQGGPKTWMKDRVFVDIETTSLDPHLGEIIEIGVVRVNPLGEVQEIFEERFDIESSEYRNAFGVGSTDVHKINASDVIGKHKFSDPVIQKKLDNLLNNPEYVNVAHNDNFEKAFFSQKLNGFWKKTDLRSGTNITHQKNGDMTPEVLWQDTRMISSALFNETKNNTLQHFSEGNGVPYVDAHSALPDAIMTFKALFNFADKLENNPIGKRPPVHASYNYI